MKAKTGRTRDFLKNLVLMGISLFLIFTFSEFVLRTTHLFGARTTWSRPDPVLAYRFIPNANYWRIKECVRPISGRMNNYGWRDEDWVVNAPDGLTRVAILGDSYVEGFQVELDSTFIQITERHLSQSLGEEVEVMNFGRSGVTQTEQYLILQNYVSGFSPEVVVVFFYPGNDIQEVTRLTAANRQRPFYTFDESGSPVLDTTFRNSRSYKSRSLINPLTRRSALAGFISSRLTAYKLNRGQKKARERNTESGGSTIPHAMSLCTKSPNLKFEDAYTHSKALIAAMADYCDERGHTMLLVCQNTEAYKPGTDKELLALDPTFDANFFEDDLAGFADSLGIEYLGLQRIFRERYADTGRELHVIHWNYEGHVVVAEVLAEKLGNILDPTPPPDTD